MAAGGTQGVDRHQHARAGNLTVANGVAQADVDVVLGAEVAHRGEAGHEGDAGIHGGIKGALGDGLLEQVHLTLAVIGLVGVGEVGMGVHEARHEGGVAQIDGLGAGGDGGRGSYREDFALAHEDQSRGDDAIALAVEHTGGFEHHHLVGGGHQERPGEQRDQYFSHRGR